MEMSLRLSEGFLRIRQTLAVCRIISKKSKETVLRKRLFI